jgi:hypothetical protein
LIHGGHQTPADDFALVGHDNDQSPRIRQKQGQAATAVGAFTQFGELAFDSRSIVYSQIDWQFMAAHNRLLAPPGGKSVERFDREYT